VPKLIYVEPDEEITSLVDRLRSEREDQNLVFVLPPASRVLQSGLNARLLLQYSNSLGKQTALVTPDPRSQGVAIETGFSVFPSLAAYQAGAALDRPSAAAPAAVALAPVPEGVSAPPRRPRPARPIEDPHAPPITTTSPARAPAPLTPTRVAARGERRFPYMPSAVGAAVVALVAAIVFLPSADIDIKTAAIPVSATPTVTGQKDTPAPGDNLAVQTSVVEVDESAAQQQFPATGQKTIPGNKATGNVVFNYQGLYCPSAENCELEAIFPKNTEVYTDSGVKFITTQDSGPVQANGGQSSPVPVASEQGAASANVPEKSVKNITNNPSGSNFQVNNPQATAGGTDPQQQQIVSQQDLDGAKSKLGDPLVQKVNNELNQKAQGNIKQITQHAVDVNFQSDHKAGDQGQNFNASLSVKGRVLSIDDSKVKSILRDQLKRKVPADYQLTSDQPKLNYNIANAELDTGKALFDGSASGFEAPRIDTQDIKQHITGKSPADARRYVNVKVNVANAQTDIVIVSHPGLWPLLPFLDWRIKVETHVENTSTSG